MKKLLTNKKLMSCLSLFLVIALVLTNLHLGGVKAKAETVTPSNGSSEIVGYRKISEPNAEFDKTNSEVKSADEAVSIKKDIEKVAGTVSDYKVKLNVTTTENAENAKDIAVAIVVDLSNSMIDSRNNMGGKTRLKAASEDIQALLTSLKDNTEGKCYVSLIGFGSNARKITDWLDINGDAKEEITYETCGGCGGTETETVTEKAYDFLMKKVTEDNLKNLVEALKGGTNIEGGLMLAKNRLAMNDLKDITSNCKFAVLVSDGEPTFYVSGSSNSTDSISGTQGGGNYCTDNDYNGAVEAARELKKSAKIFSVFIGKDSETFNINNQINRVVNISTFLGDISSKDSEGNAGVFYGDNLATLQEAFSNASAAIIAASRADGWKVTDPVAPLFTVTSNNASDFVSTNNGPKTLTWNLTADNCRQEGSGAGKVKFIYEYEYTVHLDMTQAAFIDDTPVAVNGQTVLHMLNGETMEFKVPYIKGKAPTFYYTTSFYKKNRENGNYDAIGDTITSVARINNSVSVTAADISAKCPANYAINTNASTTVVTISAIASDNKLVVKYDPIPASVKVINHLVTRRESDGQNVETTKTDYVTGLFVGDSYTFTPGENYTVGNDVYTYYQDADEQLTVTTLGTNSDNNVVNVYFKKDNRKAATVTEQKFYTSHLWNLVNGKYVYDTVGQTTSDAAVKLIDARQFDVYTVGTYSDIEGYTLKEVKFNDVKVNAGDKKTLNAGTNTVKLYYEYVQKEPDKASVTVIHNYAFNKTVVNEDGTVSTSVVTGQTIDADTFNDVHVGETVTATPVTTYEGKTYTLAQGTNTSTVVGEEGNTIELNYIGADEKPQTSTLKVVHVFEHHFVETYATTGTSIIDDEEVEVITGYATRAAVEYDVPEQEDNYPATGETLYANQLVSISAKQVEGYELVEALPTNVRANGQTITLTYVKDDRRDIRTTGKVQVVYEYYSKRLAVENNALVQKDYALDGTTSTTPTELKIGETYDITPVATYNEKSYEAAADNETSVVVQNGTKVVTVKYYRDGADEDLTPVTVKATNYFRTWNMTVENGKASYYEAGITVDSTGAAIVAPTGNYYAGMKITVTDATNDTYSVKSGDAFEVILTGNTELNYYYDNKVALPQKTASISVSYTRETVAENGTHSIVSGTSINNNSVTGYVGETKTASVNWNDEKLTGYTPAMIKEIWVNGTKVYPAEIMTLRAAAINPANDVRAIDQLPITISSNGDEVEFVLYDLIDNSVAADLLVINHLDVIDWDGEIIETSTEAAIDARYYKTNEVNVSVSEAGITFVSIDATPEDILGEIEDGVVNVKLAAGKNEVNVYFVQNVDTRVRSEVIIRHIYKTTDTYTNTTTQKSFDEVRNSFDDGIWVDNVFEVSRDDYKLSYDGYTFNFKSATPTSIVIAEVYTPDGTRVDVNPNVIEITYTREYSSYVYVPPYNPPADNPPQDNPPVDNPPTIGDETSLDLDDDDQALGDAVINDDDVDDDMDLDDDDQALGDALVKTGTVPVTVFYGFGAALMLAALILAFRKRRMV